MGGEVGGETAVGMGKKKTMLLKRQVSLHIPIISALGRTEA